MLTCHARSSPLVLARNERCGVVALLGCSGFIVVSKFLTWVVMASGLIALVACMMRPSYPQSGRWSCRLFSRKDLHVETGYLVDSTAYFNERGPYVSGRYFRLGPLAVTRVWRSPIELTNPVIQTKITRLF